MTGPRAALRPALRARARNAAVAAFVVLAATVPAAVGVADTHEVEARLPYVCTLPSGPRQATVRVSASVPQRVAPGEAIAPADVTTTVELPAEAVTDLTGLGARTVTGESELSVGVAQNEATARATWRGTAQQAELPASGPLVLAATGEVPTVTGRSAGRLTLTAAGLSLHLAPAGPDGSPTDPASLDVDCALADDAPDHGLLAAVDVGPGTAPPSGSPSAPGSPSGPEPGGAQPTDEGQSRRSPKVAGTAPAATDAPPCGYDDVEPAGPMSLDSYITGYANVNKLHGATLIPVFCALIEQGDPMFEPYPDFSGGTITQHSEGFLSYRHRKQSPPFQAHFLTFGFTPTAATMVLEETGPMTIDSLGATSFLTGFTSTDTYIRVPLVLRVTALEVNGVPLDVGPSCRTGTALSSPDPDAAHFPGDHLTLHGRGEQVTGEDSTGYLLLSGGPLTGETTIPAFTGCRGASGENVDRLLTASVSGPGNYVKQIQGQTCFAGAAVPNPLECTPDGQPLKIPVPAR